MTQQEILNLPNLKIAEVKPNMFVHIHAEDGFIITTWKEGDDIMHYSGTPCMWMPIRDEYAGEFRTITVEEHDALDALAREAHDANANNINKEQEQ
jgi:hypothetical protein